ncbi:MAG: hypothetical protein KAQ89_00545 [Planctomycetes bacterium]|nr:hypothetical protein [Planctomycetota bacterium]
MKKYRDKIKLANMLLDALDKLKIARLQHIQGKLEDFSFKCSEVTKSSNIFNAAVNKGWFKSAEKIRSRVSRNLCDFSHHLNQFKDIINSDETKSQKLSGIFADLNQVEQEFGELKFDLKAKTISVITDSIELDSISLGPFEIRLFVDQMSKLYSDAPYKAIAIEPNPAATDDNVTHPHVSSENVCEGDGHIAIRRAIEQGRLCDFFTMVVNILQTYNPDSPYVSLDDWEGISCYDCGYTVAGDECYYCENCEHDYCSSCSTYCQICDTTICLGCSFECPDCEQPVCQHCTAVCTECEETVCKNCINEEGLCHQCQEKRKEQENEEKKEETEKSQTSLEVQSDSVGQTAVLS